MPRRPPIRSTRSRSPGDVTSSSSSRSEERSVGEIAEALGLEQPSVSKHLQVLLNVGLVTARRDGRRTLYRTNADTLRTVHEWCAMFARHWGGQLRRIKAHAEENARVRTMAEDGAEEGH